eukprot:2683899-Amphidinium_carterae.2
MSCKPNGDLFQKWIAEKSRLQGTRGTCTREAVLAADNHKWHMACTEEPRTDETARMEEHPLARNAGPCREAIPNQSHGRMFMDESQVLVPNAH